MAKWPIPGQDWKLKLEPRALGLLAQSRSYRIMLSIGQWKWNTHNSGWKVSGYLNTPLQISSYIKTWHRILIGKLPNESRMARKPEKRANAVFRSTSEGWSTRTGGHRGQTHSGLRVWGISKLNFLKSGIWSFSRARVMHGPMHRLVTTPPPPQWAGPQKPPVPLLVAILPNQAGGILLPSTTDEFCLFLNVKYTKS